MSPRFEKILDRYDYDIPGELIAQAPASPRDSARVLVYDRGKNKVCEDTFLNLETYLPKNAVLVFNRTKVIPARLAVFKETGGKAELLYVAREGEAVRALSNRPLSVGSILFHTEKPLFIVKEKRGREYILALCRKIKNVAAFLEKYGTTPIPPYIKESPLSESKLRKEYQAIFAREKGSIAAPTASLHFTPRLMKKLEKSGFGIAYVTLHVGLGTFAPLTETALEQSKLHQEWFEIPQKTAEFLGRAKRDGRPIIAVGTTVVRTLESASGKNGMLARRTGATDLFIKEGYEFKFIDGMITNFHVPKSSLMMLVAALIGRKKLLELYAYAIKKKFKFFSFGDGMAVV